MEFTTLWTLVKNAAREFGENRAFIDNSTEITYSKFFDDIISMHNTLKERGMLGKHIALVGPNRYNWIVAYFAVTCNGIVMPLSNDLNWTEIERFYHQGDCEALIDVGYLGEIPENSNINMIAIEELINEIGDSTEPSILPSPSDIAAFIPTSGTMGNSRICMLKHESLCSDIHAYTTAIDCTGRTVSVLPLHHSYAMLCGILSSIASGAEVTICSDLKKLKKTISEAKPTLLSVVPAMVEGFCDDAKRIAKKLARDGMEQETAIDVAFKEIGKLIGSQCRYLIAGGAPLSPSAEQLFVKTGIALLPGYGLTERAPVVAVNRASKIKNGSVGPALKGVRVIIIDPDNNGEGEIAVSGKIVMSGYYKDSEATDETFLEDYLLTGDIGRIDEDGYIFITGRKKNIIILSNGKNIMPEEIEKHLNDLPTVIESIVYDAGNILGATVYTETPDECRKEIEELNAQMPLHKQIARIKFIDQPLARNALKKIIRKQEV